MNTNTQQPWLITAVAFVVGLLIGWMFLGWVVSPVEWSDAAPRDLALDDQNNFILTTSELFAFDGNVANVEQRMLKNWPADEAVSAICTYRSTIADPAVQQQLSNIASVALNNPAIPQPCDQFTQGTLPAVSDTTGAAIAENDDSSGLNLAPLLALIILLVVLLGAIYFVIQRRNALMSEAETMTIGGAMPEAPPTTIQGSEDSSAIPLARFQSAYTMGRDNYDDSFSVENGSGDFLGECGVGISESIGTDVPKNVTAFEVWLFDKNDIRTVTKVVMSDHAFFDEALKAKLAPKGEPVLARENEIVVLETASLIVNAEIKAMNYGSGTLPPQSFFDNFTIELSAWAKEGDTPDPDIEGRVDELLDF